VFGGMPELGDAGYGVARVGDRYELSAGSLSGVTDGAHLAVYGSELARFPPLGSAEDLAARAGLLHVTSATLTTASAVAIGAAFELPTGARARLVAAGARAQIAVELAVSDPALREAVAASPLLTLATDRTADVRLVERKDRSCVVVDDVFGTGDDGNPTLVTIPRASRQRAIAILEHYHAFTLPLRLAKQCQDLPHALRICLLDCNHMLRLTGERAQNPAFPACLPGDHAPYDLIAGDDEDGGDQICILVYNDAGHDLHVTLLACFQSGEVVIVSRAKIPAFGLRAFWNADQLGEPFRLVLPAGCQVGVDRLIAIGTTDDKASLEHLELATSFAEILAPSRADRDVWIHRGPPPPELWTATTTAIYLRRR
jgi:hypothetical protein